MLRWAHFLLILLSAGQAILSRSSKIDEEGVQDRINNNDSDDLTIMKLVYRDNTKRLFGKILGTVTIWVYQTTVFYA